jgi:anti-sigma-K factor RskA
MAVFEHVLDLIPAYALGILDGAEAEQVSEHLEVCPSCRMELRAYADVVDALPLAVLQVNPPSPLRDKILARAGQTQAAAEPAARVPAHAPVAARPAAIQPAPAPRLGWWQSVKAKLSLGAPALGVVSLALVLLLGAGSLFLWQRLDRVESQYQQVLEQYENTLQTVPLSGTEFAPNAIGLLVISKDGSHGTVVVDRLPVLDEAHEYQLWLIRDGERTSGGVFSVDEYGYGAKWIHADEPLISFPSFGVTIEPVGGSPAPTGDKVLGGDL